MSHEKLRIHNTPLDNLTSNLRGEIGEIIFSWIVLRDLRIAARARFSGDPARDMTDPQLAVLNALIDKLADDIAGRLSELAERKSGQLTFHFAAAKLRALEGEVTKYQAFVRRSRLHEKRNYDISHKVLPEQWHEHKMIFIPYGILLRGIAMALRLMKRVDRLSLGPSAPYLWREMRKRRYPPHYPASVDYMLLPYLRLTQQNRITVALEEISEGRARWEEMETTVNGEPVRVHACKPWGVFVLGDRYLAVDRYPLDTLVSIEVNEPTQNAEPLSGPGEDGNG